ncbi:MAG: hypothetical protein KDD33_02650 [Bdellovibrionales bacterium]|nr:hypothetical protein [Bdellovibrionales bacterium]
MNQNRLSLIWQRHWQKLITICLATTGLFLVQCSCHKSYDKDFESIWNFAQKNIYPQSLVQKYFTEKEYSDLSAKIKQAESWTEFEQSFNTFLDHLGVSHTQLYTKENPDYYFLRSLFTTKDPSQPKIYHIGMQTKLIKGNYIVPTTLEKYPAYEAGLKRGDMLISVDGKPFHPYLSFNHYPKKKHVLKYMRLGEVHSVSIAPIHESPHLSFIKASANSALVINKGSKNIAYYHLWTGTNDQILEDLKAFVKKHSDKSGMILDLRDGFGGAWWPYLDPFFKDRNNYFIATMKSKKDGEPMIPPQQKNNDYYSKPLVVLINEGVRSGKESLAYQFKKTSRATLVGNTTAGAFNMGLGGFSDQNKDYILYLSVGEMFLDRKQVEGIGILPDVGVDYPLTESLPSDPQLEKALQIITQ